MEKKIEKPTHVRCVDIQTGGKERHLSISIAENAVRMKQMKMKISDPLYDEYKKSLIAPEKKQEPKKAKEKQNKEIVELKKEEETEDGIPKVTDENKTEEEKISDPEANLVDEKGAKVEAPKRTVNSRAQGK